MSTSATKHLWTASYLFTMVLAKLYLQRIATIRSGKHMLGTIIWQDDMQHTHLSDHPSSSGFLPSTLLLEAACMLSLVPFSLVAHHRSRSTAAKNAAGLQQQT